MPGTGEDHTGAHGEEPHRGDRRQRCGEGRTCRAWAQEAQGRRKEVKVSLGRLVW